MSSPVITLVTWNIFSGVGSPRTPVGHVVGYGRLYGRTRYDRVIVPKIGETLRALQPDVVCLQEVDAGSQRNGQYDQLTALAELTGLREQFFQTESPAAKYHYGVGLLSRLPLEQAEGVVLPAPRFDPRGYIVARLMLPGGRSVTVFVLHLQALPHNSRLRRKQIDQVCERVQHITTPIIMAGDFNCAYRSPEFRYLVQRSGLRPLHQQATFPSYHPLVAFDNILVSPQWREISVAVVPAKYSDHMAVAAQLKLL